MNTRDAGALVETAALFRPLAGELLVLLRSLSDEGWRRPTSAGQWTVRDVVAHLLDVDLRRLSSSRDGWRPPPPVQPIDGPAALVAWLNELNAEWVHAARRLSPRVLTEQLEAAATALAEHMEEADPWQEATFPVTWAGETSSPMWLDIGREFTERWHHQDQIREALGAAPLDQPRVLQPVLEISLFALPVSYRAVEAPEGTRLALAVEGAVHAAWHLVRADGRWVLERGAADASACAIAADALQLARLLLHRLTPRQAATVLRVRGEKRLAAPLAGARAVMV